MQAKLPEPVTKEAFLVSDGFKKPVATKHHYYDTRLIPDAVDINGSPILEYEYRFRCFKTGEIRRYGTVCPDQVVASASSESDLGVN